MNKKQLRIEKRIMIDIMKSARNIQEFLWSDLNKDADIEEFRRMLRKRLLKIDNLDVSNPYYKIELKKRLLQTACICINFIRQLDERQILEYDNQVVSNLARYDKKING